MPALLALAGAILVTDALAPAGVVVGILLAVPVLLASTCPRRRDVIVVACAVAAGKAAEMLVGGAPVTPPEFWVPNRALVLLSLPASAALSLVLQRGRLAAEAATGAALRERELNRILMSLLAHDLRAPLVVARQCIAYVADALARGARPEPALLDDTATRLDRSLRAIDIVLEVARRDPGPAGGEEPLAGAASLAEVVRTEVESFRGEAAAQGKRLVLRLENAVGVEVGSALLVLRQALAIVVDNAIRYAVPGEVTVAAGADGPRLWVRVSDGGPAEAMPTAAALPRGAGLGLELSRALLAHSGGTLAETAGPRATTWTITLPAAPPRR